ncbi:hypothetical protein WK07_14435, partial [Burkholderia multivorans]
MLAQERERLSDLARLAAGQHRERTERLSLDLVDLAVQDIEIEFVAADRLRQDRLVDAGPGEREAQQM